MDEKFMRRALELARQSLEIPGALPYAAVIVKDGQVVGEGLNKALANSDPTSHGEVEAIRDACARLGTTRLDGCAIYTTAEPCSMCVATMYIAGIANLYYASAAPDSAAFTARLAAIDDKYRRRLGNDDLRHQVGTPVAQRQMPSEQFLADEAKHLFDDFAAHLGA
ncbi:MAG: nucleoside deaminase [Alphaproteobacteria bacterium]|nr:nucleoside deaminase [Alphaproteobacteria bacterium]